MNRSSRSRPPSRKSILLVDDDEEMRESIYDLLSHEYRLTLAVDGIDGHQKANVSPRPDLIIADIAMPRLDGITMVRRIQENEALRRVPVIFFTGRMSPACLIEALSLGPFAYLPKSSDPGIFEKEVKRALGDAPVSGFNAVH
jgi:CheY-like chemotaxis protein